MTLSQEHQSIKQFLDAETIEHRVNLNCLSSPIKHHLSKNARISVAGRFSSIDLKIIENLSLDIRCIQDIRDETHAMICDLVGDGFVVVSTDVHTTVIVPPFSEHEVYVGKFGSDFVIFDSYVGCVDYAKKQGIELKIDKVSLAQFLESERILASSTVFTDVSELEHASTMTILHQSNGAGTTIINHLPKLILDCLQNSIHYEDEHKKARELIFEAVANKASDSGKIGFTASGGFDSTTLAMVYGLTNPSNTPEYFHFYSSEVPKLNEINYLNELTIRYKHKMNWIDVEKNRDARLDLDSMCASFHPPKVMGYYKRNWIAHSLAKQSATDTIISGDGGDQLMLCYSACHLFQELRNEGVPYFRALTNTALLTSNSIWKILYQSWVKTDEARLTRAIHMGGVTTNHRWTYLFENATKLQSISNIEAYSDLPLSIQFQLIALSGAKRNAIYHNKLKVKERRPFLYWPLVKFALTRQRSSLTEGGRERGLFRQALLGVLPRSVLNRCDKSSDIPTTEVFDFTSILAKCQKSKIIRELVSDDKMMSINPDTITDEQAIFLNRAATIDTWVREITRDVNQKNGQNRTLTNRKKY